VCERGGGGGGTSSQRGQKRRRQDDCEEDDDDDDEMDDEEEQAHEKEIKQQFTQRVNDKRPCRAPAKILRIAKSSGFCISGHVPNLSGDKAAKALWRRSRRRTRRRRRRKRKRSEIFICQSRYLICHI
jgi:hypothetical protein